MVDGHRETIDYLGSHLDDDFCKFFYVSKMLVLRFFKGCLS